VIPIPWRGGYCWEGGTRNIPESGPCGLNVCAVSRFSGRQRDIMDTEAADKLHVDVNRVEMPPAEIAAGAHVGSLQAYRDLYQQSIEHPDVFWSEVC
jgi:hypothetical protein